MTFIAMLLTATIGIPSTYIILLFLKLTYLDYVKKASKSKLQRIASDGIRVSNKICSIALPMFILEAIYIIATVIL